MREEDPRVSSLGRAKGDAPAPDPPHAFSLTDVTRPGAYCVRRDLGFIPIWLARTDGLGSPLLEALAAIFFRSTEGFWTAEFFEKAAC